MANSNIVKFQTKLNKISFELTKVDIQRMKYLLTGIISDGHLEECKLARDLFDKLRKLSKLDENDCEILRELLELIDHQKLIKDHLKDLPHSETKQISHFRRVMFQIGKDLQRDDFEALVFNWQVELSASVRESGCVWTTFRHLEKKEVITEENLLEDNGLEEALRNIDRDDLADLLRKEFKPAPVLIHSATWPPDQSTGFETTSFNYETSMPHTTPTTKPSTQVGQMSRTPETRHAGPELLTPDYFAGPVPTNEMRGLSLSPHQGHHQLHPQYANYPMPGLVSTPRPSRSHENLAVLPGDYPSLARPSTARSISTTSLRAPENTSFMFSHLHGSGNQSHWHEGSGDQAFNSQTEQSIPFVDNSMVQGSQPRTHHDHHDDTDIGQSRNQQPAVGIRQWMTPSGPSRPAWENRQARMTQPGPHQTADLLFTLDNHYPSRPQDQSVSRQLAWEQDRGTDQLRGITQSGNAEVASGTTSGGFATRVVPAPNPSRPALEAEPVLIPERMTRGLDTSPTVREIAEPMNVETPQTGEGLTRGSEAIQPHAGLARGSEATRSPGDPSMSSEVTLASTGLSSGFEARQTHGPFASGSEAQQPPGEVTSSSEADPAAGGLSAGSEELSVGSETSLSSSASAASHTSTMTTTASTVEPPQINYPQSASEEGSTVTSNPLQESSNVIHDPSTQWKETKMGHRLKIFTYDQMSKVANQFKDEICCEGGFGNVYKGKLTLECGVTCAIAIKRMKIESRTDQGEREFQREQSVASVRHPFIVPVLGVCEEPGKPLCIVYPYMEGGDLKGAIDTMDSRLTWQKCLAIITQVSSALIYMHSHNPRILHLDVKPANILLDAFFNARLGDVGLSREIDPYKSRASLTSSHPGTPGYQDPIMMQDWSTSPTNDIYSLGVVMFRALTRKPAFHECEKKPYCVFLKRKGYLKDIEKVLELASKDIWPLDSTSESLSFTRKFAELMCSCLMTDPSERIELEDLHEQIKTLARDASCQIYTEPAEAKCRNLCVICYSNLRVPSLPLLSKDCRSSCDKVCLQCHLDSHKNPLVCPEHGEAKPPIGMHKSQMSFIISNMKFFL